VTIASDPRPAVSPRLVESSSLPVYPISREDRLDGHAFLKWWHHRWISSRTFKLASWEAQGMARALFDMAQSESPIGTLPDHDDELAVMLRIDARRIAELRRQVTSGVYPKEHLGAVDAAIKMKAMPNAKATPMPSAAQETKESKTTPPATPVPEKLPAIAAPPQSQSSLDDFFKQQRVVAAKRKAKAEEKKAERHAAQAAKTHTDYAKTILGRNQYEASKEANRLRNQPDDFVRKVASEVVKGQDFTGFTKPEMIQMIHWAIDESKGKQRDAAEQMQQRMRSGENPASQPAASKPTASQASPSVESHAKEIDDFMGNAIKKGRVDKDAIAAKIKELKGLSLDDLKGVLRGMGLKEHATGRPRSDDTVRKEIIHRIKYQMEAVPTAVLANREAMQYGPDEDTPAKPSTFPQPSKPVAKAQPAAPASPKSAASPGVDSHVADLKSLYDKAIPPSAKKGGRATDDASFTFPGKEIDAKIADIKKLPVEQIRKVAQDFGIAETGPNGPLAGPPRGNAKQLLDRIERKLKATWKAKNANYV